MQFLVAMATARVYAYTRFVVLDNSKCGPTFFSETSPCQGWWVYDLTQVSIYRSHYRATAEIVYTSGRACQLKGLYWCYQRVHILIEARVRSRELAFHPRVSNLLHPRGSDLLHLKLSDFLAKNIEYKSPSTKNWYKKNRSFKLNND